MSKFKAIDKQKDSRYHNYFPQKHSKTPFKNIKKEELWYQIGRAHV